MANNSLNSQNFETYNVSSVYKDNLCCSCGVCIGVCPNDAIKYDIDKKGFYKPSIDRELCTGCGICVQCCPGTQYFDKENQKESYMYGYSNNIELRENSSSGGVVTEMLCYLIKKNIVDYVVIVKNREKLSEPKIEITNDLKEIMDSCTSKYCPVRYGEALKKMDNINGRIAVVGLPCHIQAIKTYFQLSNLGNVQVKYYFSLFCNHLPSFNATEFLLHNLGIDSQNVEKILYRGKGWPGYFQIKTKKKEYYLPYRKTVAAGFGRYFKNTRCLLCNDPFGQKADVSFGDAYFLSENENSSGNTFCIIRNKELLNHFRVMVSENCLTLVQGPEKEKIYSTYKVLYMREKYVPVWLRTLTMIRKQIPSNHPQMPSKIPLFSFLYNLIPLTSIKLGKYRILWKLLFRKNQGTNLIKEYGEGVYLVGRK